MSFGTIIFGGSSLFVLGIIIIIMSKTINSFKKIAFIFCMILFAIVFIILGRVIAKIVTTSHPMLKTPIHKAIAGGIPILLFGLVWLFTGISDKMGSKSSLYANRIIIVILTTFLLFAKTMFITFPEISELISSSTISIIIITLAASEIANDANKSDSELSEEDFNNKMTNIGLVFMSVGIVIIYVCKSCSGKNLSDLDLSKSSSFKNINKTLNNLSQERPYFG